MHPSLATSLRRFGYISVGKRCWYKNKDTKASMICWHNFGGYRKGFKFENTNKKNPSICLHFCRLFFWIFSFFIPLKLISSHWFYRINNNILSNVCNWMQYWCNLMLMQEKKHTYIHVHKKVHLTSFSSNILRSSYGINNTSHYNQSPLGNNSFLCE